MTWLSRVNRIATPARTYVVEDVFDNPKGEESIDFEATVKVTGKAYPATRTDPAVEPESEITRVIDKATGEDITDLIHGDKKLVDSIIENALIQDEDAAHGRV
jgi:hypothetical protein